MEYNELTCIRCGRARRSTAGDMPHEATIFVSHGNYGSTVWDPVNRDYLVVLVCDDCLRAVAAQGKVMLNRPVVTRVIDNKEPWNPETYEET